MNTLPVVTYALTRTYRSHRALNDVSLTVEPGSVYALVGPNGAGKTTLIQLLMNLRQPTAGSAEILGRPSAELRGKALNRIGYISESQEMPEWMTVEAFLGYLRPFYPQWDRALERQLLADFALPPDRKLKHLSRGMRMKVAFASTLSYRPALLVLDEPLSGLDPLVRDELIQGLLDRVGETTLFLSSHDLADIESFASHVGYLEQGSLLFSEEMSALSGRFRQVEFRCEAPMPAELPGTWLETEQSGAMVRFTDSAFVGPQETAARIQAKFAGATDFVFEPMSLREIFLANARTQRAARGQARIGSSEEGHGRIRDSFGG